MLAIHGYHLENNFIYKKDAKFLSCKLSMTFNKLPWSYLGGLRAHWASDLLNDQFKYKESMFYPGSFTDLQ